MKETPASNIDVWLILDMLVCRWHWAVIGALLCAAGIGFTANKLVKPKFTATGQLLRTAGGDDLFPKENQPSPETFAGLIRAPELLQQVGALATPKIPSEIFAKQIKVEPDAESDMVNVQLAAGTAQQAVDLLNVYLTNAVQYLRMLQAQEVRQTTDAYLSKQVKQMDQDIADLDHEFHLMATPMESTKKASGKTNEADRATARNSPVVAMDMENLRTSLAEMNNLLLQYTDKHPKVQIQRAKVEAIQRQLASDTTNTSFSALSGPDATAAIPMNFQQGPQQIDPEVEILRAKILTLEQERVLLVHRQREADLYVANPPGQARIFAPATLTGVKSGHRRMKIAGASVVGGLVGLAASLALVLFTEFADGRLKTIGDIQRVTKLPVLTTLGNIDRMPESEKSQWAFRTWTLLQGYLSPTAHHGLVCGFTSSAKGEGRSTWIKLLAEAASLTGFRVLTIATRPPTGEGKNDTPQDADLLPDALQAREPGEGIKANTVELKSANGNGNGDGTANGNDQLTTREGDALSSPAQIATRLTDPDGRPVVHIPLPGWVWNRERRQQWSEALNHWRKIENIVILVELPPADMPETVLLAANLPNLIWLSNCGTARAEATRDQLETLRHARCNLVGAVLNRQRGQTVKKLFPKWITAASIAISLLSFSSAQGQISNPPALTPPTNVTSANLSFSIVNPAQKAAWQQKLTLGPGDAMNFGLFGQPELNSADIVVGPDGRVSFLEAQDILATGLTIDELRDKIDQELGKYRRAPHTMITPVAFRSKRYYMLGKVMVKGTYVLDRPITILEAIARAKGFENGLVGRSVVDLADFSRSFISRDGKRLPLDFEKLFEAGDLSQNIPIEPGDYVYIAGANVAEVYVLGEIRLPGPVGYFPTETAISAIAARGGFTERAYRSRVLVIRGSLNHPQYFVVNTADIVKGKQLDFHMEPKDIIFVSARPFIRVEELTDLATTAFIQGFITSWVGAKVITPYTTQ